MRNDFEGNYLAHYGVLGMKWGVRRYQNGDGSLTSAGKSRYKKKSSLFTSTKRAKKAKAKKKKEDISKLTDQELRQRINRQQMEQQYKRMNEDNVTKGKKFAKKVLNAAVMPMAIAATTAYITSGKSYVTHGAKGLYKGIRKGLTNAYTRKLARRMLG